MPAGRRLNGAAPRRAPGGNQGGLDIKALVSKAVANLIGSSGGGRRPPAKTQQARTRRRPNPTALNARLRSIPRHVAPRETRFAGGALRTGTFAARGHGYYDAFASKAEQTSLASSVGPCTPIEGFARFVLAGQAGVVNKNYALYPYPSSAGTLTTTPITTNVSFLIFNPGASDDVIARFYTLIDNPADGGASCIVNMQEYGATAFEGLADNPATNRLTDAQHLSDQVLATMADDNTLQSHSTGRVESIPLRGSLRMRNITESLAVGGEVRVMRYNGGLRTINDAHGTAEGPTASLGVARPVGHSAHGAMSVGMFLDVVEMMRDTKRAHTVQGAQLLSEFQANTYPADSVRSHTFQDDTSFEEAVRQPKYCSLIVLIEDFKSSSAGVSNTFSFSTVVQRAARFQPGSLLHAKATTMKTNTQAHAAGVAGEFFKPAMTAVSDMINSPIGGAIMPYIGRGINNSLGGAPELAYANMAKMIPYGELMAHMG